MTATPAPIPSVRRRLQRGRGFTLLEILIVAALISLFAGLAVFGIQQQFENNIRKTTQGEVRSIAVALDLAYADVGFFPKIALLTSSRDLLRADSQQAFGNPTRIFDFMHALGVSTAPIASGTELNWNGPYLSPAAFRAATAQGRGGSRLMAFNEPGGFSGAGRALEWPLDPYNNPYMVYILDIEADGSGLRFASDPNTRRNNDAGVSNPVNSQPGYAGTFVNAVVSYGPNNVPGGGPNFIPAGDPVAGTNEWNFRLFRGNPGNTGPPYEMIAPTEFAPARANVWSASFGVTPGGFPTAGDGSTTLIGITDVDAATGVASDDVVFAF